MAGKRWHRGLIETLFMSSLLVAFGAGGVLARVAGVVAVLNRPLLPGGLLAPVTLSLLLAGAIVIAAPLPVLALARGLDRRGVVALALAALPLFAVCFGLGIAGTLLLGTFGGRDLIPAVLVVAGAALSSALAFVVAVLVEHRSGVRRPAWMWSIRLAAVALAADGAARVYQALWGPHDPRVMNLAPFAVLVMGICCLLYGFGLCLVTALIDRSHDTADEDSGTGRSGEQARQPDAAWLAHNSDGLARRLRAQRSTEQGG